MESGQYPIYESYQEIFVDFLYCINKIFHMVTKKQDDPGLRPAPRQLEVALRALYSLGGAHRSVDTEDVAIKSYELSPAAFAWRKYPNQINLELVRVALSDAKKPPNGVLVSGSGRDGWRLTPNGVAWLLARPPTSAEPDGEQKTELAQRSAGSIDTVRKAREEQRIVRSAAWQLWRSEGRIDDDEVRKLLRIDSYTSPKLIDVKVARLLALFPPASEFGKFIEAARQRSLSKGDSDA